MTAGTKYGILYVLEEFIAVALRENIKPISYIKTNAAEMMKYVNERKNPIIITQNGEAKAVLVDIETYQETEDAFALMNIIKIAEKDIEDGRVRKSDDVFNDLRERIKKMALELYKR